MARLFSSVLAPNSALWRADDSVAAHLINDLPSTGVDNYPPA